MAALFDDKIEARQILRQHLVAVQLAVEDLKNTTTLYTLQGNTAQFYDKVSYIVNLV